MNLLDLARSALVTDPPIPAPALVSDAPRRRWRVHFPDRDSVEVTFCPDANGRAVAKFYPGSKIEPLPDSANRAATSAEIGELRDLVRIVLADDSEADRAEALAVALADPDAALVSFRALAADLIGDIESGCRSPA